MSTTYKTKIFLVLGLTAFCSICYELLIGQAIALTFGGTISSYTLTIGIFLFAMGIGSLNADRIKLDLLSVELLISLLGLLSPILILSFAAFTTMTATQMFLAKTFSFSALTLLGVLTGLEIPIAFRYLSEDQDRTLAIAFDYVGSFAAGLCFAFFMFPILGLLHSIALVAALNLSVAGFIVFAKLEKLSSAKRFSFLILSIVVLFVVFNNQSISNTPSGFLVSGP